MRWHAWALALHPLWSVCLHACAAYLHDVGQVLHFMQCGCCLARGQVLVWVALICLKAVLCSQTGFCRMWHVCRIQLRDGDNQFFTKNVLANFLPTR